MRSLRGATIVLLALSGAACQNRPPDRSLPTVIESRPDRITRLMGALAADSMAGRAMGTLGSTMAARLIATELEAAGLRPAGTDGFFQEIPAVRVTFPSGRTRVLREEVADTFPESTKQFVSDRNIIAMVRGVDCRVGDEAIVVGAHFDHVGIRDPVDGDSIYNGADDDASGVVAVLEVARAMASGAPPRRTVVFALFTGEEVGGLGSGWYLDHPAVPLENTVAQLQVEMIGRPDSLAGGSGRLWATGYERSTVGEFLAAEGISVVPDPYPGQNFFFRSDNVAFAYRGVPAHTLSSYNLHDDYHRPSDEVDAVDFEHMTAAVETVILAVRALADAPEAPRWNEGGAPRTGWPVRGGQALGMRGPEEVAIGRRLSS